MDSHSINRNDGHIIPSKDLFGHAPKPAALSAEQIEQWRTQINEVHYPMMVLNANFQPVLLNEALRVQLSEPSPIEGTNEPAAFVWQTICDTAGHIAAEHAKNGSGDAIAEAFPLHQRCFVAVGCLLKNNSGQVLGAVLNLADLTTSKTRLNALFASPGSAQGSGAVSDATEDPAAEERKVAFEQWMARREEACKKMARLSRRESQVVALVSDGLPNKSVAHELDISVKTIEKHRANATRKLGVGSTAEMVRLAVVAGNKSPLVERPPTPPMQNPPTPFR